MYQFPRGGVDSPVVVGVVFLGGIIMEHLHQLGIGLRRQQAMVQLEHVCDLHEKLVEYMYSGSIVHEYG